LILELGLLVLEKLSRKPQLTPDLHWDLGSKAWRYKQILLIVKSIHKDWGMLSEIS